MIASNHTYFAQFHGNLAPMTPKAPIASMAPMNAIDRFGGHFAKWRAEERASVGGLMIASNHTYYG
jgi:hypothetical protein